MNELPPAADLPDWQGFMAYGSIITPGRWQQLATICSLVPCNADETATIVDLACGTGTLSLALLRRFPHCRVVALDAAPQMLEAAQRILARYADRVSFGLFDLRATDWLDAMAPVRCFVSSLAIHHLDGWEKSDLFTRLHGKLEPNGALLIADIVEASNDRARALWADDWDAAVRDASLALTRSLDAYDWFRREEWNLFRYPDPEYDKPSPLADQLDWLRQAGFRGVDCFWLSAGHAVYGGFT